MIHPSQRTGKEMQAQAATPRIEFWSAFKGEVHIVLIDSYRNIRNVGVLWGVAA